MWTSNLSHELLTRTFDVFKEYMKENVLPKNLKEILQMKQNYIAEEIE